jgi:hypothetical protein
MKSPKKRSAGPRSVAARRPRGKKTQAIPAAAPTAPEQQFVQGLLVREEAAKPVKGKLPLNATHVITKENPDGTAEVKRVRFKTF